MCRELSLKCISYELPLEFGADFCRLSVYSACQLLFWAWVCLRYLLHYHQPAPTLDILQTPVNYSAGDRDQFPIQGIQHHSWHHLLSGTLFLQLYEKFRHHHRFQGTSENGLLFELFDTMAPSMPKCFFWHFDIWRTETPHVYRKPVSSTEDDFGCPVEARLYVRVDLLILVATGPKVDHLYAAASHLMHKHIRTSCQVIPSLKHRPIG